MMRKIGVFLGFLLGLILFAACSTTKFVETDELLVDRVELTTNDKNLDASGLRGYVRQEPNVRWFGLSRVPLAIYNLSSDSTGGWNKFLRRMGEPPVLLDSVLTLKSRMAIEEAVRGKGYLNAQTWANVSAKGKKAKVDYTVEPGQLYRVNTYHLSVDDTRIDSILRRNETKGRLYSGMPLDLSLLDDERERVVSLLHREGYLGVLKDFISYEVDSMRGPERLDLTMKVEGKTRSKRPQSVYDRYRVRQVLIDVYPELDVVSQKNLPDTLSYFEPSSGGNPAAESPLLIVYHGQRSLKAKTLATCMYLLPGDYYNEDLTSSIYRALSNLAFVKFATIQTIEADSALVDLHINVQQNKVNSVSAEVEGTNTSGDFGVAGVLSYTNRNLFRGGESWTTSLELAFEAIDGLEGYDGNNYFEVSLESSLTFPRILSPFRFSHRRNSSLAGQSALRVQYNTQDRPEFHRRVLTGAWQYRWDGLRRTDGSRSLQHKLDVLSINYVFMPWISSTFRSDYLENSTAESAIVRYSYQDLFIVNSAYGFVYKTTANRPSDYRQTSQTQFSLNIETAGNLLSLIAHATHADKDEDGALQLFNVGFAQYAKLDLDLAHTYQLGAVSSIALHGAFGIALPYGNSTIVPFEKRYYAGGPNSIRGWSTRELGPGSFRDPDGATDFINQTGNLKLLLNAELRSHLFWKIHGALFVDAGNVWNTHTYASTPGGKFRFNTFYKQIAASYGLGMRLNMDYFILRLDFGMKAVNPVYDSKREHYPFYHPSLGRDLTVHFAVGLPF